MVEDMLLKTSTQGVTLLKPAGCTFVYLKTFKLLELALNIRLKTLGSEHVAVAASNNNLCLAHKELGDFE